MKLLDFDTENVINMSKMRNKCVVTGATSLILTKVQNVAFVPEGPVLVFHYSLM